MEIYFLSIVFVKNHHSNTSYTSSIRQRSLALIKRCKKVANKTDENSRFRVSKLSKNRFGEDSLEPDFDDFPASDLQTVCTIRSAVKFYIGYVFLGYFFIPKTSSKTLRYNGEVHL